MAGNLRKNKNLRHNLRRNTFFSGRFGSKLPAGARALSLKERITAAMGAAAPCETKRVASCTGQKADGIAGTDTPIYTYIYTYVYID